jgi:hypothetical protein
VKHGLILALLALSGCQTCREHKVDCAMAAGLAVGIAVVSRSVSPPRHRYGDMPSICQTQPSACQ